ncbi:colony stimulating factor 3 (granulocyte) a isoform X1 [Phyllopteryx taeniolatus]|uniref:colony stimulating factor 3 (granulocyte) a isoform X1 n=2 Tax=Phyllopteryx taeniolatus TaxID=161469 RepID=UPI002AD3C351|nr:colony stimulating factor 3 (granulocyte) a isoform X1 [Phyllopteryx taeniolatus]
MRVLIVFALPLFYMARIAGAAPLPEVCADMCALVEGAQFQVLVRRSRSLTEKILLAIPDAHRSSIYAETLKLNSPENAKLDTMASNINFPAAPVFKIASEKVSLESSLKHVHEGLQLHQALLSLVSSRLEAQRVTDLMNTVRDLAIQISKMLRALQTDYVAQTTPSPVTLYLHGDFEVQVAAHLTLVQLQSLGQDTHRFLRGLDTSHEPETDSDLLTQLK